MPHPHSGGGGGRECVAGILIVDVWTVALYACVTLLSLFAMLLIK